MLSTFYPVILISRLVNYRPSPIWFFLSTGNKGVGVYFWVISVNCKYGAYKVVQLPIKVKYIYPFCYLDLETGYLVFPQEIKGWDFF
jgi:hypothetical protein